MVLDLEKELAAALGSPSVQTVLAEIVRAAVRDELELLGIGDDLLDVEQAARFLSMTEGSRRKAAQRGTVPCTRIGRRLRFHRRELLALGKRDRVRSRR